MTDQMNRSGGADFNANDVDIGGDVAGRDKITQQTTHNYYGALPAQPRRAELPNQPYFFGREDELKIIAEALDPESNGWGVLIDGPGGIGKTALAIRAGHVASDKIYPTKIFLSAKVRELTPQGEQKLEDFMLSNYLTLLSELARELGDEGIERIVPAERTREVRRLLENSHALIIIDNLEAFDEKERDRLFQFLRRLPRSCKAIVTSRRRTDVAAEIIRLDRLSSEDTQKLIAKLAARNKYLARATEPERQELYEITKGNPLLIEWMVGQLGRSESRCRTIVDACHYLENAPKVNDPLEYIFGDLLDTFTEHETAVLAALTHFALPAKEKWIAQAARLALPVAQIALEDLTDRSLLASDVQTRTFILSPLVATFLRQCERYSDIINQTGGVMVATVIDLVEENGYKRKDRYPVLEDEWPAIAASVPLLLQGDNDELQCFCQGIYRFLSYSGRLDARLFLGLKGEERAVSADDFVNAGWRARDAGRVYFLRGQGKEVLNCARRVEKYWAEAGPREKGYASRLRGWGHRLEKDYPAAILALEQALEWWQKIVPQDDDKLAKIAKGLNSLAEVKRLADDYVGAESDYWEALQIDEQINHLEGQADVLSNLSALEMARGAWVNAEDLARRSLELAETGKLDRVIADASCHLAVSLVRRAQKTEAVFYAQRAVDIFTRLRHRELEDARAVLQECGG